MEFVLNEKEYIENILKTHIFPENKSINTIYVLIGKYGWSMGLRSKELVDYIIDQINLLSPLPLSYQEYKMQPKFKKLARDFAANPNLSILKEKDFIPIYKEEIDKINELSTDKEKKIVFTSYVLARINSKNNDIGWVNYNLPLVFKLANVTSGKNERHEFIGRLSDKGYFERKKSQENNGYKVLFHPNGEIVMRITDFNNLGNQFLGKYKDGYTQCQCCGKVFKLKSRKGRPSIYCKKCAEAVQLESDKIYQAKKRAEANFRR